MNLIFARAKSDVKRIVLAEGEEEETIKAAILLRDNKCAVPILVGRENKILAKLETLGVDYDLKGIEIMNASVNNKIDSYIEYLYARLQRKGFLYRDVARMVKTDRNIFASCMVACGDADGMVTGLTKNYSICLEDALKVIDPKPDHVVFAYSILISKEDNILIADNSVHEIPSAEDMANIAIQASEIIKSMGDKPQIAMLSSSNFGNRILEKNSRIKEAIRILEARKVNFAFDGEMTAELALNTHLRKNLYPFSRLTDTANVLIMPNLNSASISTGLLEHVAGGVFIGPILTGLKSSVQIVQIGATATEIFNFAAIASVGG